MRTEKSFISIEEHRRIVKAVSCRCAAQIAYQRIENRQRNALSALFKMDLPPEAALIVERALYDTGAPREIKALRLIEEREARHG